MTYKALIFEKTKDETFYGRYEKVPGKSYAKVGFKKLNLTGNLNESFICAGYSRHVKDICFPKPGNSLMVNVENHWVLVGISINNLDCEKPGLPHIYRRVGFYLDWIKTIVR
uniref:Peptidase S1 domain-containing protein n=1 Tax=Tetranychus urticae TaxID=32264 RepID=T1L3C2_TETUR